MATKAKRRRIKFQIEADSQSKVSVAGSFNNWDPSKHNLKLKDGVHALNILLEPGQYEYKFVVNDIWCVDPACQDWVPNDCGSLNSVIDVA